MSHRSIPALLPLSIAVLALRFAGACAMGPAPRPEPRPRPATGVEHTVQKGETLWQISRAYGVSIELIALANELDSKSRIDEGQRLFIPGAQRELGLSRPGGAAPSPPVPRKAPATQRATPAPSPTPPPRAARALPNLQDRADQGERHEDAPTTARPTASLPAESRQYLPPPKSPDRPLAWPVRGVLYARFGKRAESVHDGIDLSAPEGTPIRAAADGRVLFSAPQQGYGNLIIVEHEGGLLTLYAHNRENLVKEGERVRLGQVIARMGSGSATSGPYLHFEVRIAGQPKDPLDYLPPPR